MRNRAATAAFAATSGLRLAWPDPALPRLAPSTGAAGRATLGP